MSDPPSNPSDGKLVALFKASIPVLAAVVTAAGGYGGAWLQYRGSNHATVSTDAVVAPAPGGSPEQGTARVTITPPDGPVSRCVTVKGTAATPDGVTTWVAVRAVDNDTYSDFKKVAVDPSRPDQWQVKLPLGSENDVGKEFIFYAFALHGEASRLLENIETGAVPENAWSYYFLRQLPVQVGVASERFQRDDNVKSPHC